MGRYTSVLCTALLFAACATTVPVSQHVRFIEKPNDRSLHPDDYFGVEYGRINARRAHFGFAHAEGNQRPAKIISLALSGGGIRSNAFQLGILAGLHDESFGGVTLLDRVDYIASVSGGTWANLAVWAWPDDVSSLFQCLDDGALHGFANANAACTDALLLLRTHQRVRIIPVPDQRKEVWQHDIEATSLKRCNPESFVSFTAQCAKNALLTKPYFIVASTHDSPGDQGRLEHFPFETTADGIATVIDESPRQGFAMSFSPEGEQWQRRKFTARFHLPGSLTDGTKLSLTAAHSSAVLEGTGGGLRALFLDFYYQLSNDGKRVSDESGRLREHYVLADGGKSDDTGIVPLVDRGADVIVASYMGKDSVPFDDFDLAARQVEKLFGCAASNVDHSLCHKAFQEGTYTCPANAAKQIAHVHPWLNNIDQFRASFPRDVRDYLETTDKLAQDRFPQSKTFQTRYDEELIRAYYLLGKFMVKENVAPYLRRQLQ
jgi:predicted acylesterase/phospholipase RssA